jgi:hypothetical protein
MLIEDIQTRIIPFAWGSGKESFKIELAPTSKAVEAIVAAGLTTRDRGPYRELQSAVCDFVRECAQSVLTFGEAAYEIVYKSKPATQEIVGFELESIRPLTVKRRGQEFVQTVPQVIAERKGSPSRITLGADDVVVFQVPAQMRNYLEEVLDSLVVLSEKLMPEFALKSLAEAGSKYHYDSGDQVRAQKLALAEAGKGIGWNARGLFGDDMLEFYVLRRQLRFEHFKIEFRNSIVDRLNAALRIAGKRMGFTGQIQIDGLPKLSDVETAVRELEYGTKPFGEILKPFLA